MMRSKKLLQLFLFLTPLAGLGQSKLCLLGTVHNPTKKVNSDSIYAILNHFSPTIILYESDAVLDIRNNLRGVDGGDSNEFVAINNFLKTNPATRIFPFDWAEKQQFMKQTNYRKRIDSMNVAINHHLSKGKPTRLSLTIIESLIDFSEINRKLLEEDSFTINQPYTRSVVELKTKWEHEKLIEMANADDSLKNLVPIIELAQTYWKLRNENMVLNILRIIEANPQNRILVLTGNNHKYFLYNALADKQDSYRFNLLEFWENHSK